MTAPEDLDRLAQRAERLGELLRDRGPHALNLARALRTHLRAATTNGGPRSHDTPDPTGDTATTHADSDNLFGLRLESAISLADVAVAGLTNLLAGLTPPPKAKHDPTNAPPGHCASCYRDNRHLEVEHRHADGRVKHKGLCAWCAGFLADYGQRPPVDLLTKRHRGGRITTGDISRALTTQRTNGHRPRQGA